MTESWSDVRLRYQSLKGWFWHLVYLPPTCEFLAAYCYFRILTVDDARLIIDDVWQL